MRRPQRIVGKGGDALRRRGAGHPVERIPCILGTLAVLRTLYEIAAFVIPITDARIFLEQVVQQFR